MDTLEGYGLHRLALKFVEAVGTSASLTVGRAGSRIRSRTVDELCAALGDDLRGAWTPAVAEAARAALRLVPRAGYPATVVPASYAALKSVRMAHGVLTGDPAGAPAHELLRVLGGWERRNDVPRNVIDALRAVARDHAAVPGGEPDRLVGIAFPWPARAKGSTAREARLGSTRVDLPVASGRVDVVLRLTPDDVDPFDLVALDGVLYRPVFAPGSWEPMDPGAFAVAASGGRGWIDAPYHPPFAAGGVALAPSDVCRPDLVETAHQQADREEARLAAVRRAGRMVVIGGLVHRETGKPDLDVRLRRGWDFGVMRGPTSTLDIGWRFPDGLGSGTDMSTASRAPDHAPASLGLPGLPVAMGGPVLSALRDWSAVPRDARDRFGRSVSDVVPVEVVDHDAFPSHPSDLLDVAAGIPASTPRRVGQARDFDGLPDGASLARHLAVAAHAMVAEADEAGRDLAAFSP